MKFIIFLVIFKIPLQISHSFYQTSKHFFLSWNVVRGILACSDTPDYVSPREDRLKNMVNEVNAILLSTDERIMSYSSLSSDLIKWPSFPYLHFYRHFHVPVELI